MICVYSNVKIGEILTLKNTLLTILILLLISCDGQQGGCPNGVDECGVCGGDDINNDNCCQIDLDILQAIKNGNTSLNSTTVYNMGYQIWGGYTYQGQEDFFDWYDDVSYRRLVMLDLSYNELTSIPFQISNFRFGELDMLYLNNNQIETIPESICLLNADKTIVYLNSNKICNELIFSCFEENDEWHIDNQDQSNCCEGPEGQENWTTCP